jgi:peptidoglycan/LPS O-acetylase OafA/YrhL
MHEPTRFDFIDTLRGLAILAVIAVHSHIAVAPATPWLQALMAGGARGVQLFYIASALTLCLSWNFRSSREHTPLKNFYVRRLFRIAPMFYVAIVLYVALYGLEPRFYAPNGVEWHYVPLTALFLNGFHPEMVTSVVPGGWSIVVEMTFYLVLPLLVTRFRSIGWLVVLVIVSLVMERVMGRIYRGIYLPMYPPDQQYIVHNFVFLNFFGQFPVFAIGMLAYGFFRDDRLKTRAIFAGTTAFLMWLGWRWFRGEGPMSVLMLHVPIGAAFALFALALSQWPVRILVNPLTRWIGRLSFSMYLVHFAVIDAFAALGLSQWFGGGDAAAIAYYALAVAVTTPVAALCHRFIERPGIEAGRRLLERRAPASAAA